MKYTKKSSKKTNSRLPLIILGLLIAGSLAGIGSWYLFIRDNATNPENISTPADDPNFSDGEERNPNTESVPRDGGVVDTSGEDSNENENSAGITSSSGKITVYQPAANALLNDGASLSGKAKVSMVSYRLIDDKIGVIGTGTLKVVNGKFSGKFSFSSGGNEGRLDIFNQLSDGREVDIVEIPVRFK